MTIEETEFLLGHMIAAAKSRGLGWCKGVMYADVHGESTWRDDPAVAMCCALGALDLLPPGELQSDIRGAVYGNDIDGLWMDRGEDDGESLGWAYRQAMTVDE